MAALHALKKIQKERDRVSTDQLIAGHHQPPQKTLIRGLKLWCLSTLLEEKSIIWEDWLTTMKRTHELCYDRFYGFTALTFVENFYVNQTILFEILAGVKAGSIHLCRVTGNTVWSGDPIWQVTSRSWEMGFPLNMLLYLFGGQLSAVKSIGCQMSRGQTSRGQMAAVKCHGPRFCY